MNQNKLPMECYSFPVNTRVSVGVSSQLVLASDPTRYYIAFMNPNSGVNIFLQFSGAAAVNSGMLAPTNTYLLEFVRDTHKWLVTGEWTAIATGAGGLLTVISMSELCKSSNIERVERNLYVSNSESTQPNFRGNRYNRIGTGVRKPTEGRLNNISTPFKSVQPLFQRQTGGIGSRINNISGDKPAFIDFGLRLTSKGGDSGNLFGSGTND